MRCPFLNVCSTSWRRNWTGVDPTRRHGLGRGEGLSKPGSHDFAAHELLVAAHVHVPVRMIRAVRLVMRVDVDELHDEVGVRSGAAHFEPRGDLAAERHVFAKRLRLERQHVTAGAEAALIVAHVLIQHAVLDGRPVAPTGHRLRGIALVLAVRACFARRGRGKRAIRVEIVRPPFAVGDGQRSKRTHCFRPVSNISASGRPSVPVALEVRVEERRLHVALILAFPASRRSRDRREQSG